MLFKILIRLAFAVIVNLTAAGCIGYTLWARTVSRTDPGNSLSWAIGLICLAAALMPSQVDIEALVQWAQDRKQGVSSV